MKTEQFDFANEQAWTLMTLHQQARELSFTKETSVIPRQRDEADHILLHVAFEMWARRHLDRQPGLQGEPGAGQAE